MFHNLLASQHGNIVLQAVLEVPEAVKEDKKKRKDSTEESSEAKKRKKQDNEKTETGDVDATSPVKTETTTAEVKLEELIAVTTPTEPKTEEMTEAPPPSTAQETTTPPPVAAVTPTAAVIKSEDQKPEDKKEEKVEMLHCNCDMTNLFSPKRRLLIQRFSRALNSLT